jgi:hypothetical protein
MKIFAYALLLLATLETSTVFSSPLDISTTSLAGCPQNQPYRYKVTLAFEASIQNPNATGTIVQNECFDHELNSDEKKALKSEVESDATSSTGKIKLLSIVLVSH